MMIELMHPNGQNSRKCNPKQAERLRKLGWRDCDGGQPIAEVVKFMSMPKEIKEVMESGCKCGEGCCDKTSDVNVQYMPEETETITEDISAPVTNLSAPVPSKEEHEPKKPGRKPLKR